MASKFILPLALWSLNLFFNGDNLAAQAPSPPPSDFSTARAVFVANAGIPALVTREKFGVSRIYDEFNRQLAAWNRYKIVSSPKDGDLALELSVQVSSSVSLGLGSPGEDAYVKLDIRDIKTHALLWTLDEPFRGAIRETAFLKNIHDSVALLVDDLKALAAGKQPGQTVGKQPVQTPDPAVQKQP